jgi:hypothetical protein
MASINTFNGLLPDMKETYSDSSKKKEKEKPKKFTRVQDLINPGKATAEAKASQDPMKALKDKSYLNIKGKKGVAV